ncbi:TIGR01244 family sulfur transferase [Rhizorhabdus dicambivorans]|uniref:TIGR01244 family phosphatase n=1 Tax=Rhizorhabdus dicambivorans TaxID=1850238 RepID=A0A2A4FNW6_9SPHN|nr:TIGR01244 family sulfur transferase [Rhizorhabdus dicambivorans]ATE63811.1 TIGR01244 family phosphatase [Rhizorhabdus dicambivorans]PCE40455.1 TIGR01244 family phosphatase [Rhizorhabdus dicambivorans]
MFRKIDETISVAPQISVEQVQQAADQGFTTIINNRPEQEEPGQPSGDAIREAARGAGLAYVAIPITPGGFTAQQVEAMQKALSEAKGPVLAFCRSGTRSTFVWALARGAAGDDPATLAEKAANAGYDISPIAPLLARR